MKERVAAALVAVMLVAGALVVRSLLVGDGGGSTPHNASSTKPTLACTPDLAEVCARLADAHLIAPAPKTLDLDQADRPDDAVDAWLTWDPGPRVADFADTSTTIWSDVAPVAHGSLAAGGTGDAIRSACSGPVTWTCVSRAPGKDRTVGVGDPATSEALARLAPVARALSTGETDTTVARVRTVIASPPNGQDDAATMVAQLVTQPGAVDLVVAPSAVLADAIATPQGLARNLETHVPAPSSDAAVVLAIRTGRTGPTAAQICQVARAQLRAVGASSCGGSLMSDNLAGLLYQVHDKVG